MKSRLSFTFVIALLGGSLVHGATNGTVSVVNASFEEPVTANFDTTVTGWFEEHTNIYREAVQNENSASTVPDTPYGANWIVLTDASGVYQAIDTFSPDWGYTFSELLIGSRVDWLFGSLEVELWVGNGTGGTGVALSSFATLRDSMSFDIAESSSPQSKLIDTFTLYTGNADSEGETVWLRVSSTDGGSVSSDSQVFCDNLNITAGYNPRMWGGLAVDSTGHVNTGSGLGWFYVPSDPWIWSYKLSKWIYFRDPGPVWSGAWSYLPIPPEVVSAPVFSPAGGHYDSGVSVTITSETPGATIRYTMDGSEPTRTHGTIYSGPIPVNTVSELRAIAYKEGAVESDVLIAGYGFGRVVLTPSQAVVDAGNGAPNLYYGRIQPGGAHVSSIITGGWQITHALAVASGNSSAEAKLLNQIQSSLMGNGCISANGGYPAQHERLVTGAYTILKDTPFWENTLTETERNKITLLMKATLIASAYTTADATYVGNVTALDGDTNLNRGWNPNFREGMFGGLIHATVFFGGVTAIEEMLNNYDHAAFVAELQAAGLTNTYETFNWAADHEGSGAPSGAQIESNIRNYRYNGKRLKSPMGQLYDLTVNTYAGTVSCGLNGGAGILVNDNRLGEVATGTIASGCDELPNKGKQGMLQEFATSDAIGPRSSATYAYDGFRPNLTNHVVVLNGGYWDEGSSAETTILNRLNIGITDLDYKLDHGYRSYAKGNGNTTVFDYSAIGGWSYTFNTTLPLWFELLKPYHGL